MMKNVTVEEQRSMGIRRVQFTPAEPQSNTALARDRKSVV